MVPGAVTLPGIEGSRAAVRGFGGEVTFRVVDDEAPPPGNAGGAGDSGSGGEPAFILDEGVPYVRGWSAAEQATQALRAELRAWGLSDRFAYLRAEVTVAGTGVVDLGRVTPAVAELLADLLAQARLGSDSTSSQTRVA
jgi:hypothetical protein